jgi:hypothetical protein
VLSHATKNGLVREAGQGPLHERLSGRTNNENGWLIAAVAMVVNQHNKKGRQDERKRTTNASQTGDQVRPPAEEDGKGPTCDKNKQEEVI